MAGVASRSQTPGLSDLSDPSRRRLLQRASGLGIGLGIGLGAEVLGRSAFSQHNDPATLAPPPEPMLHTLKLPPFVDALPLPSRAVPAQDPAGSRTLRIRMREIHAKVHRDVPATRMWSYGESTLAPLIDVRAHQPLRIEWINDLPRKHFLPIDYSLHGCGHDVPEVRAVVHVHGARVRAEEDGGPMDWYPSGHRVTNTYPLAQDGTTLWYHDHAMGLNRLNVYAGLFGMFLVRDEVEDGLALPGGHRELPLILYDRDFTQDGQLFYPISDKPGHPWVPEFTADAVLINGRIRPFVEVEARLYRLRLLDAANSRFFRLSLGPAMGSGTGAAASGPIGPSVPFLQIGSDQGLLRSPARLTALSMAPGERMDVLVDFSRFAGQNIYLWNGAFPILQFRVEARVWAARGGKGEETYEARRDASVPSEAADSARQTEFPSSRVLRDVQRLPESSATRTRTITLNEFRDPAGNTLAMLLNRKHWHEPVTEIVRLNSTEIWEFVNLTEDTHPMHLHLVRFQILDRRPFDPFVYTMRGEKLFTGPAIPPRENEAGWKDVVACDPGTITRVILRFEGFTGRYLYHCHILEHEANDMMRPYDIVAESPPSGAL